MTLLQWADAHFSAAHRGEDGRLHGHTWRVRAHWLYDGEDAEVRRRSLHIATRQLDHVELHQSRSRAEDIAALLGEGLAACRVDVWREPEGMGATWTA